MERIKQFFETEGRWKITYQNGNVVDFDNKPIEYEYIGESITFPSFAAVCTINSIKVVKYQQISAK